MFEKIIRSKLGTTSNQKDSLKKFYILTHKKHQREIFFEEGSVEALKFMGSKFKSLKKRGIYFLLKIGVLQPFLKKVWLPSKQGSLIFVGGQIKVFNFDKSEVLSFCMPHQKKEDFLRFRNVQKKMGELGFAPKIFKIDKKRILSKEELLSSPERIEEQKIFRKLIEYYSTLKIKKVESSEYIKTLKISLRSKKIQDKFLSEVFELLQKDPKILYLLNCHGDFAEGQILEKKNEIVFSDWSPYKNLITEDISNFFRSTQDLLSNRKILEIWKLYPSKIQNDLVYYLILCEIRHVVWKPFYLDQAKKRIKNLINSSHFKNNYK
jgi:hypothetical protein